MKLVARIAHLFEKTRSYRVHDVYDEWSWHIESSLYSIGINILNSLYWDNAYLFKIHKKDVSLDILFSMFRLPTRIFEYMCMYYPDVVSKYKMFGDNNMKIYNKYFLEP